MTPSCLTRVTGLFAISACPALTARFGGHGNRNRRGRNDGGGVKSNAAQLVVNASPFRLQLGANIHSTPPPVSDRSLHLSPIPPAPKEQVRSIPGRIASEFAIFGIERTSHLFVRRRRGVRRAEHCEVGNRIDKQTLGRDCRLAAQWSEQLGKDQHPEIGRVGSWKTWKTVRRRNDEEIVINVYNKSAPAFVANVQD